MITRLASMAMVLAAPILFTPNNAHAADWLAKNMNLQYDNGQGTATASRAQFKIEEQNFDFTDASFDISWGADQLVIERPQDSFRYTIETSFLKDVKTAQVEALNFEAAPGKIDFGVQHARLEKIKDTTVLDATTLVCQSAAREENPVDACIDYTRLNSDGVETESVNIKAASLAITRGKLNFTVDLKGIGKIKGEGSASHDAATQTVKIKINQVKLSFISVTGQFFGQLENIKSDMIRVERPYIYVTYGKKEEPAH